MALVDRIRGEDRPGRMPNGTFIGGHGLAGFGAASALGYVIDGAVYALDGQPPPAPVGDWGDMGWALRDIYGRPVTSRG